MSNIVNKFQQIINIQEEYFSKSIETLNIQSSNREIKEIEKTYSI